MNILRQCEYIHARALMKMKAHNNKYMLNFLWLFLEPMLFVALFYVVFTVLMPGSRSEDFLTFLIVGKIPFLWFSKGMNSGANSVNENKGLIGARKTSKIQFPLINCHEVFYKQIFALLMMLSYLYFSGYQYINVWWQLVYLMVLQYLLIAGVAMIFSFFVTYANDFQVVLSFITMGLMFTSGIFWDINELPESTRIMIETWNPLALLIKEYRQILLHGEIVPFSSLISVGTWALMFIAFGSFLLGYGNQMLTRRMLQ